MSEIVSYGSELLLIKDFNYYKCKCCCTTFTMHANGIIFVIVPLALWINFKQDKVNRSLKAIFKIN